MKLQSISLQNFRSYKEKKLHFDNPLVVFVGPNAAGKTNLMEAICLLSQGRSFRADMDEEMITQGDELARVKSDIEADGETQELEIVLTRGELNGQRVGKKKFVVNGIAKRMTDFTGMFRTVLFGPWDLEIVTDSPGIRRRFLDSILSQVDREYRRALLSYEKGLRQRNKLLERLRDQGGSRSILLFWDKLLIKNGNYLTDKREELLSFLTMFQPLLVSGIRFQTVYRRSTISESRIQQYTEAELAAGLTLVGPHRDDVEFVLEKGGKFFDLAKFGSRGEQRLGVLWLKLGELEFLTSRGERPVLLLDDIFSELDHKHRELVMAAIGSQQTFITTADEHLLDSLPKNVHIVSLEQ